MKILVLGNSTSHWQRMFVKRVLLPLRHKIYELADRNATAQQNWGNENDIIVEPLAVSPLLMKIPKIRAAAILNSEVEVLSANEPYDTIINMFVSNSALFCARALKGKHTRLIAYYCGSDILRLRGFKLFVMKHNIRHVDCIVFASEQVKSGFIQKCGQPGNICEKVIHLGVSVFDEIDKLRRSGVNCKQIREISDSKVTVCIGYNGNPSQQHIAVIEQLSRLSAEEKCKLHLILPMTYSGTESYYQHVEERIKEERISYSIFKEYMNDEEMASLHSAVDIFINSQKTDGLSASVMEAMYAGAVLLNASWLDYPEYKDWGLLYETYKNFEELPDLIRKVIHGESQVDKLENHEILKSKMSWDSTKNAWEQLLKDVAKGNN